MAIVDARTLTTPIYFSGDDVVPIEAAQPDQSKAIRGLQEITNRNSTERAHAVSALVRLASGGRRVRANEDRRDN